MDNRMGYRILNILILPIWWKCQESVHTEVESKITESIANGKYK